MREYLEVSQAGSQDVYRYGKDALTTRYGIRAENCWCYTPLPLSSILPPFFFSGDAQKKLVKTVAGCACKRLELTRPCISVKYLPMEIVLPIAPLHQSGGVYIITL